MKKIISIVFCITIALSCMINVNAEQTQNTISADNAPVSIDSLLQYIEQNTTEVVNPDGSVTVTLNPIIDNPILANQITTTTSNVSSQSNVVNYNDETDPPVFLSKAPDYSYTTGQTHTPISFDEKYLYSLLSEKWKGYYRKLDQAVRNLDKTVLFPENRTTMQDSRLYYIYMFDNPELFYLGAQYTYVYTNTTFEIYLPYAVSSTEYCGYHNPITDDLRNKIVQKKNKFDNAVKNFISTIPSNAPDYVKEYLIYSKILINSYYNQIAVDLDLWDKKAEDNWTAYGIMCNGKGVCESYAEAFQTLCNAVGIQCTGVSGYGNGGRHKWNAVKIRGNWYQCDITWDDPLNGKEGIALHNYFNLTDAEMQSKKHDWSECEYTVPQCTATSFGRERILAYLGDNRDGNVHFYKTPCDTTCENCSATRTVSNHVSNGSCPNCARYYLNGWYNDNGKLCFYEIGFKTYNAWRYKDGELVYLNSDGVLATNSWVYGSDGKTKYFVDDQGYIVRDRWATANKTYRIYFDSNGQMVVNKWKSIDNSWYFFDTNGYMLKNAWKLDSVGWCYVGNDGKMVTNNFAKDAKGWCYMAGSGYFLEDTCWIKMDNEWFFIENGYRAENKWVIYQNKWYYFNADGKMLTDSWKLNGADWYFLGSDGKMVTNCWKPDKSGWCYLGSDGKMVKNNFVKDSNGWAYIGNNGYFVTITNWIKLNNDSYYLQNGYRYDNKWLKYNNNWYFFNSDGKMATNSWKLDSIGWCYVGNDGKMVTNNFAKDTKGWCYIGFNGYHDKSSGWKQINGYWYFLDAGYRIENMWLKDTQNWCYLGSDGKMVTVGFAKDSKGWCYMSSSGYFVALNGWQKINGDWYYLNNGYRVENSWIKDSKGWCYVGNDGKMLTNTFVQDAKGKCWLNSNGYWNEQYI